jgi:hypothetical protein
MLALVKGCQCLCGCVSGSNGAEVPLLVCMFVLVWGKLPRVHSVGWRELVLVLVWVTEWWFFCLAKKKKLNELTSLTFYSKNFF